MYQFVFCPIIAKTYLSYFIAEHMLFMGSTEFPDENEVCELIFTVQVAVGLKLIALCSSLTSNMLLN